MNKCAWTKKVGPWLDGECQDGAAFERHVDACGICAAHAAGLRTIRGAVKSLTVKQTIADAQVPAFVSGIRERLEEPAPGRRGFWAVACVTIAALLVALAAFNLLTGGPQQVLATEIESVGSDVPGATVTSSVSEDGTVDIRVSIPVEDSP